jgi:hypothetical protein
MDVTLAIIIMCLTALVYQRQKHVHELDLNFHKKDLDSLVARIEQLEVIRTQEVDQRAFQELQSKVDALRLAQGLKVGR